MVDFLICYEHIVREVENDTLIKYELEKRGYTCEIMPFNGPGFFQHALLEDARVVITPWLRYDENTFHYLKLAAKPHKLVNLQWEQVYSQDDLNSGMVSTSTQAKKAFHLCWGDNSKERLTLAGVAERNLIITGAIQLDYGRPAFEAYFLDRGSIASEFELDCSKEWLLLISSFAYVNYGSDAIKELENQFGCSLVEQVKLHTASQSVVLDWTERLMKAVDYEIIYRPHPSEKVDDRLKKMQVHYPRFHVIPNYSVKQWAKVSDKTNLWISTSNAELSAMGIDYAIVRPVPIPAELEVESMREESFITDYDAFFQYNTSGADGFSISPSERMKKLSHYYSYDENVPSYVKVADCLEKIIKTDCGATYYFSFSQQIRFGWQELKKLVISFIMEKYQNKPYHTRVSRLPLKQIIRNNIIRNLDNHAQEKQTEAAMLQYMENEVPPQNSARNTYN